MYYTVGSIIFKQQTGYSNQQALNSSPTMLRGLGSNERPSGYEPDELPLLYPAMRKQNIYIIVSNIFYILYHYKFKIPNS